MAPRMRVSKFIVILPVLIISLLICIPFTFISYDDFILLLSQTYANDTNHHQQLNQTYIHINNNITDHVNITNENNKLFCPLPMTDGYDNLLQHIYELQYVKDCHDNNQKFYIWEHQCNVGVFASLECIAYYFAQAIYANRTFLMKGSWTFSNDEDIKKYHCTENSMDCYFLPISTCNVDDVLKYEKSKSNPSIFYLTPEDDVKRSDALNNDLRFWKYSEPGKSQRMVTQRILYVPKEWGYIRLNPDKRMSNILRKYYGNGVERRSFVAVIESYLFRMRPYINNVVNEIVFRSFMRNANIKNISNYVYNVNNSVSIMIRWGDKCKNKELRDKKYPHPEMECYTYHEYMTLIKTLKRMVPNLEYVIVTCDSKVIIDNITIQYKEWMNHNGMKFITNVGDIMHGSSTMDRFSTSSNALMILISMLSTMRIQFASKYYLLQQRSFWNTGIFNLVEKLLCHPLSKNQLVNDYGSKLQFENLMNTDRMEVHLAGTIGKRIVNMYGLTDLAKQYGLDFEKILNSEQT